MAIFPATESWSAVTEEVELAVRRRAFAWFEADPCMPVFIRLVDNSSLKMVSPELASNRVQLDKGRAMVKELDIRKENDIRIRPRRLEDQIETWQYEDDPSFSVYTFLPAGGIFRARADGFYSPVAGIGRLTSTTVTIRMPSANSTVLTDTVSRRRDERVVE